MPNVCQSITLNMALFTVRIEFSARRLKRGQLNWGLGKFSNSGFQIGKYDKSVHKNIIRPKYKGETEYKECANNIDTFPIHGLHTLHKKRTLCLIVKLYCLYFSGVIIISAKSMQEDYGKKRTAGDAQKDIRGLVCRCSYVGL